MKIEQLLRRKGTRIISVRMDVVVKDVCGTEGDTIVGMLSERDFLRAIVDLGPAVLKKPVSSLMSRNVISCSPRDDLAHAVELFDQHQIRHLPIIDNHTLIGVISIRDVIAVNAAEMSVQSVQLEHRTAA
jgi:CBS domain-containing protein